MIGALCPTPWDHQAARGEQVADRGPARPRRIRITARRDGEQLLGAPPRMPLPHRDQRRHQIRIGRLRTRMGAGDWSCSPTAPAAAYRSTHL